MPKFDRLAWVQFNLDRIFVGLENNRMDPRETRGQERQETCGHTKEDPSKPGRTQDVSRTKTTQVGFFFSLKGFFFPEMGLIIKLVCCRLVNY